MSDLFRIVRGLEIDETIRLLYTAGPPGGTTDTDSALVGSLCTNTLTGDLYLKRLAGAGSTKWFMVQDPSLLLYKENSSSPVAPTALATNSIALGSGATSNAIGSLAIGDQSLSNIQGGVVQASGRFASSGDAQAGRYLLRSYTTSGAETELFVDGTNGSVRLVMPDDATWTFSAMITGHRVDDTDGHAGFRLEGVIYRVAGVSSVSMQGKVNKDIIARSSIFGGWDVNAYADPINGSLKITATGQTGKQIRWVARVDTVEVTN